MQASHSKYNNTSVNNQTSSPVEVNDPGSECKVLYKRMEPQYNSHNPTYRTMNSQVCAPVNEFSTNPGLSRKTTFNDGMKESFMKTQVQSQEEFEWDERSVAAGLQQCKDLLSQNDQLQTLIDEHISDVKLRHKA